tara:strand:+ start:16935 stop:18794 length:1860 start_codon:yes stop_codon:yes gene_type:complete
MFEDYINITKEKFLENRVIPVLFILSVLLLTLQFRYYFGLNSSTGTLQNILYNISSGSLMITENDFDIPMNVFGFHLIPIMFFLIPFYKVFGISFVYILSALMVFIYSLSFYYLSKEMGLKNKLSSVIAIFTIINSTIIVGSLFTLTFRFLSIGVLSVAIYHLEKDNFKNTFYLFLTFLLFGEAGAPIGFSYGIYMIIFKKEKFYGGLLSVISCLYFLFYLKLSSFVNYDQYLYSNQLSQLFNPIELFNLLASYDRLVPIFLISLPFLPFLFLSPIVLLSIPVLFMNMLSDAGITPQYAYALTPIIPIFFHSYIIGIKKLKEIKNLKNSVILAIILPTFLLSLYVYNPIKFAYHHKSTPLSITDHDRLAWQMGELIPKSSSLSSSFELRSINWDRTTAYLFPRISNRFQLLNAFGYEPFTNPVTRDCDYVFVDVTKQSMIRKQRMKIFNNLLKNKIEYHDVYNDSVVIKNLNSNYGVIEYIDGLFLLKKDYPLQFDDFISVSDVPNDAIKAVNFHPDLDSAYFVYQNDVTNQPILEIYFSTNKKVINPVVIKITGHEKNGDLIYDNHTAYHQPFYGLFFENGNYMIDGFVKDVILCPVNTTKLSKFSKVYPDSLRVTFY